MHFKRRIRSMFGYYRHKIACQRRIRGLPAPPRPHVVAMACVLFGHSASTLDCEVCIKYCGLCTHSVLAAAFPLVQADGLDSFDLEDGFPGPRPAPTVAVDFFS